MTESKSFIFRFRDVEVREREFILVKAGEVLPIEPKAFRVLLFLLHNPQKLITKEELLDAVWVDAAVTESSLTRSIAKLRRTLGDDFQEPRYIATVTTLGYRLVCSVEVSEETSGETGGETEQREVGVVGGAIQVKPRGAAVFDLRRWWLLAGAVLPIGLAAAIWNLRRPPPPPRISEYVQITHDSSQKAFVGTDGNRLYFTESGQESIAQIAISGGEIAHIPVAVPAPGLIDVSPDGSSFLVLSDPAGPTVSPPLWNVKVLGGSLRRLADADSAAFSPDGNSVAYSTRGGDIFLVRSDGTDAHKLVSVGARITLTGWSPDGAAMTFDKDSRLWEMSSNGSNLHQILPSWHVSSWQCCGHWTPDGKFIVFLSGGSFLQGDGIWALDLRHSLFGRPLAEPVQLTTGPMRWGMPIPGKDGKKIFAQGITRRGELSRYDAQTKRFQPFLSGISAEGVTFSKDGQSVAYVSYPEGLLWKANRDGSSPVQLSNPPIFAFMPRWSPDGAQIVFMNMNILNPQSPTKSYIVSSEGGSPRKPLPESSAAETDPDWSSDGRKIVFCNCSLDFSDKSCELRIFDVGSRQVTTVPGSAGMFSPRLSRDGQSLAALSYDSLSLRIFDFKTQRWSTLGRKMLQGFPEWSKDSRSIYFLGQYLGDWCLFRIRVTGGEAERLVDLRGLHLTGADSQWVGLDPTDAPLLLRDTGNDDIYALTLEQK
ncbi:MAG: winged helix-turn-helix domain-containing protein [Terracidiphilus sp.]